MHPDQNVCGEGNRDGLSGRYNRSPGAHGARGEQEPGAPDGGGGSSGSGEQPGQGAAQRAAQGTRAGKQHGYPRSDERIKEELHERLGSRSDLDLRNVTVEAVSATVTLRGAVPEPWMRQAIEDITDHCFGVQDIDNGIRVEPRA
ncbi:MAG: BON domain-containing protein [Steroidobacteraceae bacterium]